MEYKRKMIKGYENYEVDTLGNVYSLDNQNRTLSSDGKLSERIVGCGYAAVSLYGVTKKPKQVGIHRLVWEAFKSPIPEGMEIDHINNNRLNNMISNLQLMSKRDNLLKMWDRRGRSEIKETIKDWLARGYSRKFISDNLNVSECYISMISTGKR
tara:strand:- start:72 stop:536 length:465 start_codon:yes stop_codon:yes gene_type:complete